MRTSCVEKESFAPSSDSTIFWTSARSASYQFAKISCENKTNPTKAAFIYAAAQQESIEIQTMIGDDRTRELF